MLKRTTKMRHRLAALALTFVLTTPVLAQPTEQGGSWLDTLQGWWTAVWRAPWGEAWAASEASPHIDPNGAEASPRIDPDGDGLSTQADQPTSGQTEASPHIDPDG